MMQTDGANDQCGQASQPASQALDEQQQSYEDRKRQFKWAMYKFMFTEKQGVKTKYFQFEELKNSIFLSNFSEDHLKYWIKKQQNSYWIVKELYIIWTHELSNTSLEDNRWSVDKHINRNDSLS